MSAKIKDNTLTQMESEFAPETPPSGSALLYVNTSGIFRQIDDAGNDLSLSFDLSLEAYDASGAITGVEEFIVSENGADSVNDITIFGTPIYTHRNYLLVDTSLLLGNTTLTTVKMLGGALIVDGTSSSSPISDSLGERLTWTTSTSNNVPIGFLNSSSSITRCMWIDDTTNALFYTKITTPSNISNLVIFAGIGSNTLINDNIGSDQGVYFRYSTATDGINWHGIVHASSANRTDTTLGYLMATSGIYELMFFLAPSGVRFYIDGVYLGEVDYPTGFGGFGGGAQVSIQTTDGVAKSFDIWTLYTEVNA